ncbi:signal peptide protein [Candidatus Magnetobacterium bavaricum]|uniref:Signal peptide protein n=1 Tax=Candidatus Magnetobacterium bavaricum TaxID=29290 RepID=A0A0F3GZ85_9BACT|nr:signal peptide protein [Candidatus Magnetobacterium bavaricum]
MFEMSMKRCESGHYFDNDKYSSCPVCGVEDIDIGATIPKGGLSKSKGNNVDLDIDFDLGIGQTKHINKPGHGPDEGATIGVVRKDKGIDPVVGWLVCIDGSERGRDYRIRSEKNFIGRGDNMQICIKGDDTISRENHSIISYNPKTNSFKILPGTGKGLVYLNDDEVDAPRELKPFDEIEIGKTKLKFFPCCGENFKW